MPGDLIDKVDSATTTPQPHGSAYRRSGFWCFGNLPNDDGNDNHSGELICVLL